MVASWVASGPTSGIEVLTTGTGLPRHAGVATHLGSSFVDLSSRSVDSQAFYSPDRRKLGRCDLSWCCLSSSLSLGRSDILLKSAACVSTFTSRLSTRDCNPVVSSSACIVVDLIPPVISLVAWFCVLDYIQSVKVRF